MLNKKVLKALTEQVNKELYSSYLYLQMAAWFQSRNLLGFANWMRVQAQEELAHAMIFYNFMNERGAFVDLNAIAKPALAYDSPLGAFEQVAEHEALVTASIYAIMDAATKERDYATQRRLDWFISEQVEEEANAAELVGKLKLVNDSNGLFMLDKELALRTFVMPPPLATAGA